MRTYLDWIATYPVQAFFLGCFILALAGIVVNGISNFFVKIARSITGHYPPPSPTVDCDCDPCYCCRTGQCDNACRCWDSVTGDGTDV